LSVSILLHATLQATDFYEYGWGDSFHFAHTKVGEAHMDAIYRHEHYLSEHLGLKKGDTAVDVGCGVGGPAREIASFSGADIVGITINEYQVERAQNMTSAADLADQVSYVQGDFTQMPFSDEKFDHAYAIEATCHAPQLRK
jgi:sterol 24-C-methyltransferase